MSVAPKGIEATVDRWEGDMAVLKTSDGQEILWPGSDLPDGVAEGSVVRLVAVLEGALTEDKQALAREVLNEVFGSADSSK